jgi:hypothetical protein
VRIAETGRLLLVSLSLESGLRRPEHPKPCSAIRWGQIKRVLPQPGGVRQCPLEGAVPDSVDAVLQPLSDTFVGIEPPCRAWCVNSSTLPRGSSHLGISRVNKVHGQNS